MKVIAAVLMAFALYLLATDTGAQDRARLALAQAGLPITRESIEQIVDERIEKWMATHRLPQAAPEAVGQSDDRPDWLTNPYTPLSR